MKGFTLIEMAIVLTVVGILTGFGVMGLVSSLSESRAYALEKEKVDKAARAVIQYAADNSSRSLPEEEFFLKNILRDVQDKNAYSYLKYVPHGLNNGNICRDNATEMEITLCEDENCANSKIVKNAAFVIISNGKNAVNDSLAGNRVYIYPKSKEKDDIIKYYTLAQIQSLLKCDGKLRILNDVFPPLAQGFKVNDILIKAAGGKPFINGSLEEYEWCAEEAETNDRNKIFSSSAGSRKLLITNSTASAVLPPSVNCENTALPWRKAEYLRIRSDNATGAYDIKSGVYRATFFVRDAAGKTAKKTFAVSFTDNQ